MSLNPFGPLLGLLKGIYGGVGAMCYVSTWTLRVIAQCKGLNPKL